MHATLYQCIVSFLDNEHAVICMLRWGVYVCVHVYKCVCTWVYVHAVAVCVCASDAQPL